MKNYDLESQKDLHIRVCCHHATFNKRTGEITGIHDSWEDAEKAMQESVEKILKGRSWYTSEEKTDMVNQFTNNTEVKTLYTGEKYKLRGQPKEKIHGNNDGTIHQ